MLDGSTLVVAGAMLGGLAGSITYLFRMLMVAQRSEAEYQLGQLHAEADEWREMMLGTMVRRPRSSWAIEPVSGMAKGKGSGTAVTHKGKAVENVLKMPDDDADLTLIRNWRPTDANR